MIPHALIRLLSRFRNHQVATRLSLVVLAALTMQLWLATASADEKKTQDEDSWQVIYIGKDRVGYARTVQRETEVDGQTLIVMNSESHMTLKRFGQTIRFIQVLQTTETKDGDWLSFVSEMRNPPAKPNRTVGTIKDNKLTLEETINGRTSKRTIDWSRDLKAPGYQDRMLMDPPIKPGETRKFRTFETQFKQPTDIKVKADDYRNVKNHEGKNIKALKLAMTQSILPQMTVTVYMDEKGNSIKTETPFLGTSLVTFTVPKEVALEEIAGSELDLAVGTLIEVPRIENAHSRKKVVYRVITPDEDATKYLVTGESQKVRKVSEEVAEVTVISLRPDANPRNVKTDDEFLESSRFLQSKDSEVVRHADRAAGGEVNATKIALKMEKYVRDKITEKNFSTAMASAGEVARSLEGDCTEHACLLAAMLRAKRIPSRVAVGMVYVDRLSKFGGHMWTEAYLGGKWIPLDATLGKGGIGAGHIKLAQSSFSDDEPSPMTTFVPLINILGKMKIEVVSVE
ncbi:MAG: hypothetical protein CMJ78_04280 [Planctomycetaceae bacterium]|nr:hypothetical protein [Planctomycetaceae bacterium]